MIHELFLVVTLIVQLQGGQPVGTATGFFYTHGGQLYLVTNRHVVADDAGKIRPDALRITIHTDARDVRKTVDIDVPLYRDGKPRWRPQRARESQADIAIVELDQRVFREGVVLTSLSKDDFLPEGCPISPGESLMVIGYPRGLHDEVHQLPIVRNATASSAYGIPFQGAPFFLVDADLHPGMSGSPVLTKPARELHAACNAGGPDTRRSYFLGVHSARVNVNVRGGRESLGLGTVWYARLIEEILAGFRAP